MAVNGSIVSPRSTPPISALTLAAAKALFSLVVRSLVFICRASTALLPLFEISRQGPCSHEGTEEGERHKRDFNFHHRLPLNDLEAHCDAARCYCASFRCAGGVLKTTGPARSCDFPPKSWHWFRSALLRRTLETRLMSVNDLKADINVSSCDFRHASRPAELGAL
jgi:hypothetical protein